jgi:hypothetical protein
MKRLLILLFIFPLGLYSQNTWFRLLPGWKAFDSHIAYDTIITVCNGSYQGKEYVYIDYSKLSGGTYIFTDTIDYSDISGDSTINNIMFYPGMSLIDTPNYILRFGFSYGDSISVGYRWRAGIFQKKYNDQYNQLYNLSEDTFRSHMVHFSKIKGDYFTIVHWAEDFGQIGGTNNFKLLRLREGRSSEIIRKRNEITKNHQIYYDNVIGDNQNNSILFLKTSNNWDYTGGPNSYQGEILKIDTLGNIIWNCRPNDDKCTNSSNLTMIQKPNGNILCSWNDMELPPYCNSSHSNPYAVNNDNMKIWFAEIDYLTGVVLWRKEVNDFIEKHMIPNFSPTRLNLQIKDVKLFDSAFYWIGDRILFVEGSNIWKQTPSLLKTDIYGNPVWYRETNMFPSDTGDKGMIVSSFIVTPDSGFLLSGEYENRYGQLSGGEYWQKAAILKLDKYGCFIPGCHKSGQITPITKSISLKIYPNPVSNTLIIPVLEDADYEIFNVNGGIVMKGRVSNEIDISKLKTGIYILKITSETGVFFNKFIKH